MIPTEERQQKHHEVAFGVRKEQEKRRKGAADQRAAKKVPKAIDLKQEAPTTKPELAMEDSQSADVIMDEAVIP